MSTHPHQGVLLTQMRTKKRIKLTSLEMPIVSIIAQEILDLANLNLESRQIKLDLSPPIDMISK